MNKGFVYVLRDTKHKAVKIGSAANVEQRIKPMKTANPFLEVYLKVETSKYKALEKAVQEIIKLVARKRQIGNSEFYKITPEEAKMIMLNMGRVFDKDDFIVVNENSKKISKGGDKPSEVLKSENHTNAIIAGRVGFDALGIDIGEELVFVPTGAVVRVADTKNQVTYNNKEYSLSGFAREFMPHKSRSGQYQGPKYFSYKNELLTDLRARISAVK